MVADLDLNLQAFAQQVGNLLKAQRTLINGNVLDLSALTTTNKNNLVAAINEIKAGLGAAGATNLDGLSDVIITAPAAGQVLRNNGAGQFVNVDPTTYFQPRDSDLDAIAALVTTGFGRGLLTLADAVALTAAINQGTTAARGALQLATNAQTVTGADTALATTSAGTKAAIDARIDNTAGLTSNSTVNAPSVQAAKNYIDGIIAANDAMVFKGVIDASANPNYPASNRGDTYRISVAGKIGGAAGPNVEVGDLLIALTDGTAAGTQAAVGAQWNITQANIDGAVTGPAVSVSGNLASFSGTGGKVVQDSGLSVDTDGALAANSDNRLATQKAVKTYSQAKSADLTAIAGLVSAANKMPYATGPGTWALADLTPAARTLLDDADVTAMRGTLQVFSTGEIGAVDTDYVAILNAAMV